MQALIWGKAPVRDLNSKIGFIRSHTAQIGRPIIVLTFGMKEAPCIVDTPRQTRKLLCKIHLCVSAADDPRRGPNMDLLCLSGKLRVINITVCQALSG